MILTIVMIMTIMTVVMKPNDGNDYGNNVYENDDQYVWTMKIICNGNDVLCVVMCICNNVCNVLCM